MVQNLLEFPSIIFLKKYTLNLTFLFCVISFKNHLKFIKLMEFMEIKGTKFSKMWRQDGSWCWAPPCKNDDKIHNSPSKDDLGQPYKLTNQAELWTHM